MQPFSRYPHGMSSISKQTAHLTKQTLVQLDHAHVWHPFTPMQQWREKEPLIIDRGEGDFLIDIEGNRYIDGVSSLWCNVHGHRVPEIDQAVRDQLDKIAHTTLLGLASPPSIELAARLADITPGQLNKVFYSDAGATAVEVAFKLAVGYWYHKGQPQRKKFIGISGAYHGDTVGAMSVGYSDLFHRPFVSMVFETLWAPSPDCARPPGHIKRKLRDLCEGGSCHACLVGEGCDSPDWPSECPGLTEMVRDDCLAGLDKMLTDHAGEVAAIVIEPIMQGAAGMICQPEGYLRGVAQLAKKHDVLLIADEVAVGFGRTGEMFACQREGVEPDLMCLAKGISGGYLPLAATMISDEIDEAFCGALEERKTFYHGHTYTGNPLACAAAIASLDLFEKNNLIMRSREMAKVITRKLKPLQQCPNVLDIRQRGLMTGIEICQSRENAQPFDFAKQIGHQLCDAMRAKGVIVRPLGSVLILMPMPAMQMENLERLLDVVVETILAWDFSAGIG